MDNSAFWYRDGNPICGVWVEMDDISDWEELRAKLCEESLIDPDYGGDLLVACATDLCKHCVSTQCDAFSFTDWDKIQGALVDSEPEVIDAYIKCFGDFDAGRCEDRYAGHYDSDRDMAEDYIESTGMLSEMPDNLSMYFDYDAFTRDLMFDYSEHNGHYFHAG